jgi:hypothetical protein
MTAMSDTEQIAAAFEACSLPKQAWTHAAHLRVGLWHVLRFPPAEALDRLRRGILALNEFHGTANTDDSGYHETITRFYVHLIREFAARADRTRPIDELAAEWISIAGDSKLPLQYYSAARLFSAYARSSWVEPDLKPLPVS